MLPARPSSSTQSPLLPELSLTSLDSDALLPLVFAALLTDRPFSSSAHSRDVNKTQCN